MSQSFALFAALAAAQGAAAAGAPVSEIVPLYVSTNRPLAMLTVGDNFPLPIVFDTGTDSNILDSTYASRTGLKATGHTTMIDGGTGKSREVPLAPLPDTRLSGVALDATSAELIDYRAGDEVGIFGPNSFGNRYVVIEAGLNRVRLMAKNSGFVPPDRGHPYKGNLPAAEVTVGGKIYDATIDTGNDGELVLGSDLVTRTLLKAPAKVIGIARSALGEKEVLGGELAGVLVAGPIRIQSPEVTFSLPGGGANIGFPTIRQLTIVLDPANKRSWVLDPAAEHPVWTDYTGKFGPRTIRLEQGKLIHQREGRPAFELQYLGGDLFEMPKTRDRLQFFRKDGRVIRLELITVDGQVVPAERSA